MLNMSDFVSLPKVITNIRIGEFILHIYAYRRLNLAESKRACKEWLIQNKRKSFPAKGESKIVTIIGHNLE